MCVNYKIPTSHITRSCLQILFICLEERSRARVFAAFLLLLLLMFCAPFVRLVWSPRARIYVASRTLGHFADLCDTHAMQPLRAFICVQVRTRARVVFVCVTYFLSCCAAAAVGCKLQRLHRACILLGSYSAASAAAHTAMHTHSVWSVTQKV